jgi:hypothetical protein
MILAGLNSLDELDRVEKEAEEERERVEREAAVDELLAHPTPPSDFNFDPNLVTPAFDPSWVCSRSQLEELGFDGGTPQTPAGV